MIKIESAWLEHTGGTKFYQVFQLTPDEGKSITVTHWGKASIAGGFKSVRPILGGETQLHEGRVMGSKVRAKEKRDYEWVQTLSRNEEDNSVWFVQHFGAELAHRMEIAMFGAAPAVTEDPVAPKPKRETTSIGKAEPEESRPATWGTW